MHFDNLQPCLVATSFIGKLPTLLMYTVNAGVFQSPYA